MQNKNNQMAAAGAAGAVGAGPATKSAPRVPATQLDDVRSYMFEMETKETLHVDRLGADDVARAIEKLAIQSRMWVCTDGDDTLIIKLSNQWKVKIMRDGAVVVKVSDYVLIADDRFILLVADKDGWYVPIAKGDEITWDGTEEYFSPSDIRRLARDVARRILEQARWL